MARRRSSAARRASEPTEREKHWRRIIAKQRRSGLTQTEFCKKESLSRHSFFWWKRELRVRDEKRKSGKSKEAARLVTVSVRPTVTAASTGVFEVVLAAGRVLRVPAGFDADSLKRLLRVLEDGTC